MKAYIRSWVCFIIIIFVLIPVDGLEIKNTGTVEACLYYKGKPLFAMGPMNELVLFSVKFGSKTFDVRKWAKWQNSHGMNAVRCYPESGWGWCPIDAQGRIFPFKILKKKPPKFDLTKFNAAYWKNFRKVCEHLDKMGVIVQLQLFQQCYFEDNKPTRWKTNFWNPKNNINDFTKNLKNNHEDHHPFIEDAVSGNKKLLSHQLKYLHHILDAIANTKNVFIDLSNEMGDGGLDADLCLKWVDTICTEIQAWEKKTGKDILVGMDYTHFPRMDRIIAHPKMELAICHGNQVPDEAWAVRSIFRKPVVALNSRDPFYIGYGDSLVASRFRMYHWRGMMCKAQFMGDYSKKWQIDPEAFDSTAFYAQIQRKFFKRIKHYPDMKYTPRVVEDKPEGTEAHVLRLRDKEVVVYLCCPKPSTGISYPESRLKMIWMGNMGKCHAEIFNPRNGKILKKQEMEIDDDLILDLPGFYEDIVVLVKSMGMP